MSEQQPEPGPVQPPDPPNHPQRAKDVPALIAKRIG
jgi:hypothetical protein